MAKTRNLPGHIWDTPQAADQVIAPGDLVMINSAGFAAEMDGAAVTPRGGAGIALGATDSTGLAAGAISSLSQEGDIEVNATGLTQASVLALVYGVDKNTVSLSALDGPLIGRLVKYISATRCVIRVGMGPSQ